MIQFKVEYLTPEGIRHETVWPVPSSLLAVEAFRNFWPDAEILSVCEFYSYHPARANFNGVIPLPAAV